MSILSWAILAVISFVGGCAIARLSKEDKTHRRSKYTPDELIKILETKNKKHAHR